MDMDARCRLGFYEWNHEHYLLLLVLNIYVSCF